MLEKNVSTSRWGLGYNLGLLLKQLSKGLLVTIVIVIILGVLNTYYLNKNYNFSLTEIAIAIFGIIATLVFLKATLLFMSYRIFNHTEFDGSFFVTALLVTLLLIVALASVSFLASSRIDDFPTNELKWLLPKVFGIVSVFLFATFRLSYWIFKR